MIPIYSSAQKKDESKIVNSNCDLNKCECSANKAVLFKGANLDSLFQLVEKDYNTIINDTAYVACVYHMLAAYLYNRKDYKKAVYLNKKAIELRKKFEDGLLWKSYMNLGVALTNELKCLDAINFLNLSYKNEKAKRSKDSVLIYRSLGTNYSKLGELEKAERFAKRSINIANVSFVGKAKAFFDYSKILIETEDKKKMTKALAFADSSLLYFSGGNDYINALNNKAISNRWLGNYIKAEKIYNEVLNSETEKIEIKSAALNNIGFIKLKQYLFESAIMYFNSSLDTLMLKYDMKYHSEYAKRFGNLGDSYLGLNKLKIALANYQLAIINSTNSFKLEDVFEAPAISNKLYVYDNINFMEYLDGKGKTAYQLYKKESDLKYLNLARDTYETAFDFHSKLYDQITTQSSRLIQAKTIMPYIENALKVQYEYKQLDKNYEANAFKFMELNKASVLMQEINESQALKKVGIPEDDLLEEKGLRVSIASMEETISQLNKESKSRKKELDEELFKLKNQQDHLVRKLENNYPAYKYLKYQPSDLQLNEVQQQLDDSSAILEYFVGDNLIYVMTIQKEQVDFHQLDKPIYWDSRINSLQSFISTDDYIHYKYKPKEFTKDAYYLYQLLLEKPLGYINDKICKLQIIPDGKLNYIPFEILLTEHWNEDSIKYDKLPYLRNEKIISYAYSTELLLKSKTERRSSSITDYSIYAGNYSGSNYLEVSCDKLTSSIPEGFTGQVYKDDACSIANFKETANQNKVINFFLHGDTGKLVFTPRKDSIEYLLKINDLYNIELNNVELAILTACLTGYGPHEKGEGVISISRAFTYAGCSSLIMSLWSVPAKSTCDIIHTFINKLNSGKAKDEILHAAKTAYLEQCATDDDTYECHPVHWAGFVASGNLEPIEFH